jgi:integrase
VSRLHEAVEDYLSIRRALGYKLDTHGRLLADFVSYLEQAAATTVTTELALACAKRPADASPAWWAARLSMARSFARYLATLDPANQVPPADLLPHRTRRSTPYLYSDAEIAALLTAAGALSPPFRAATYTTLFGLLAATGLRVGEAIRLGRDDIDVEHVRIGQVDQRQALAHQPTTQMRQQPQLAGRRPQRVSPPGQFREEALRGLLQRPGHPHPRRLTHTHDRLLTGAHAPDKEASSIRRP